MAAWEEEGSQINRCRWKEKYVVVLAVFFALLGFASPHQPLLRRPVLMPLIPNAQEIAHRAKHASGDVITRLCSCQPVCNQPYPVCGGTCPAPRVCNPNAAGLCICG